MMEYWLSQTQSGTMKAAICLVVFTANLAVAATLAAEQIEQAQLSEAYRLRADGNPAASAALLERLLHSGSRPESKEETGEAWNLLGMAYQDLEVHGKARICYETAIRQLKGHPEWESAYVAVLANLAGLEIAMGQVKPADALAKKALLLYEKMGQERSIAVVSTCLAMIAISRKHFKAAQQLIDEAFGAVTQADDMKAEDMETLYDTRGIVSEHFRRYKDAAEDFQRALKLGSNSPTGSQSALGITYVLCARVSRESGDTEAAIADIQKALRILGASIGPNTLDYVRAELEYARILRAVGDHAEFLSIERNARRALAEIQLRECGGCTVRADEF